MSIQIKLAKFSVMTLLAAVAFSANAENSEAGGGPFEAGAPATVFLAGPTSSADGDTAQQQSDLNLARPAIVSVGAPSFGTDDDTLYARAQEGSVAAATSNMNGMQ